jgi:hypothetical protein
LLLTTTFYYGSSISFFALTGDFVTGFGYIFTLSKLLPVNSLWWIVIFSSAFPSGT